MGFLETSLMSGTLGARPAAGVGNLGRLYFATDVAILYQNIASAWVQLSRSLPAKVALAAVDTGGGIFSWVNPLGAAIIIAKVVVDVTTIASGACSIDVGWTVASGTTQDDRFIDGLDVHSSTGTFSTIDQAGANGKERAKLASGGWVTGTKDSGASAGLVGSAYVFWDPA